ncbi:MAG TPA: M67 family metallopeptidase, partial [Pyrinomonadaceae bacterium]|nr:M67 family metallopeptidase [Pyrinomonadaceae bacterium]
KAEPFRTSGGKATKHSFGIVMIALKQAHTNEIVGHAREENPRECCGLIGGNGDRTETVYRMRNIAADPLVTYEAAPEDLFAAQRAMRERGEQLMAIYHSHPRANDPTPSPTDVRLAYYPSAVYFIVGLGNEEPCLRAFRISDREGRWEPAEYEVRSHSDE